MIFVTKADIHATIDRVLPPVLEPFEFLIGKWQTRTKNSLDFPLDFSTAIVGYEEILQFAIADVTMFGTPSVNFRLVSLKIISSINIYLWSNI